MKPMGDLPSSTCCFLCLLRGWLAITIRRGEIKITDEEIRGLAGKQLFSVIRPVNERVGVLALNQRSELVELSLVIVNKNQFVHKMPPRGLLDQIVGIVVNLEES
jgi:hypothetical protein